MSKKKDKHHEEHIDESWLIPYADLLTLLLALFIVLFAMSTIDAQKFAQMAKSFNTTFEGGTSVLDYPAPVENQNEPLQIDPVEDEEDASEQEAEDATTEQEELAVLKEKIDSYIRENNLDLELNTTLTEEGLLITIVNDIFFSSGSAAIAERDKELAKDISELLEMDEPRDIVISGHTDNVPIRNATFNSNWHLSVMRAVNFMSVLIEQNPQLDPRLLSAKGFGEYKPVATNETAEGRKNNRRVEILIHPNR